MLLRTRPVKPVVGVGRRERRRGEMACEPRLGVAGLHELETFAGEGLRIGGGGKRTALVRHFIYKLDDRRGARAPRRPRPI